MRLRNAWEHPTIVRPGLTVLFSILFVSSLPARAQTSQLQQNEPAATDKKDAGQSKPSLLTPLKPATQDDTYHPITGRQRLRWFLTNTIGPPHLVGGLFTSAFGTAVDGPKEYGPRLVWICDRVGRALRLRF